MPPILIPTDIISAALIAFHDIMVANQWRLDHLSAEEAAAEAKADSAPWKAWQAWLLSVMPKAQ